MKIFFSAGEPSGDLHGANLIRQLKCRHPDVECSGFGGPQMAEAGCQLHTDLTRLAVMWLAGALAHIPEFWGLVSRANRTFAHHRPDAVVLIDYPGFNWWIARRAHAHGIPVYYFAPPQLWAWASWRVRKMRRYVDHVLCSLPFEESWFRERGCKATFIGHPYFDEVRRQQLDREFVDHQRADGRRLVTILPGSRTQEVERNLKWFLAAANRIHAALPNVRFAVASFKPRQAQMAREMIRAAQLSARSLPIEVHVRRTPELIYLAECCLAVSGSVSLELLYQQKPTVILYHISRAADWVQRRMRKVKYITLVNLLSSDELFPKDISSYEPDQPGHEKVLFPEYLTCEDKSLQLARHVIEWLTDPRKRQELVGKLADLKQRVAHGGASATAAELILRELGELRPPVPRPHFLPAAGSPAALLRPLVCR
jgi:lipid-A-disaccharide synthase